MAYEYWGYLKSLLPNPPADVTEALPRIAFTADDLAGWTNHDLDTAREWQRPTAMRARTREGVRLTGQFEDVRRLDVLPADDPAIWVPLGSMDTNDERFPIDLDRFGVVELTYRIASDNGVPMWMWTYPGGLYLGRLPAVRRWLTVACLIPHNGFPARLDQFVIRLYSTTRTTESLDVQSLVFRALSPSEREACNADRARLEIEAKPKSYPALESFLPLGVCMDAQVTRRLAEMMGISLSEYWELAFEDIALHNHNCVEMENTTQLTSDEWREVLQQAEAYGLRLVISHRIQLGESQEQKRRFVDSRIRPNAGASSVLAWNLCSEATEAVFPELIQLKSLVEAADPKRPMLFKTRHTTALPLFGPHFPVASMCHFPSHSPWEYGEMVRAHVPLCGGGRLWVHGPTFIHGSGAPEWSTCPELRLMVNLAFANGARGWFSNMYHSDPLWMTGSCERSLTGPFLTFCDLWQELGQRMGRFEAVAPLLLQSEPDRLPERWYAPSQRAGEHSMLPEGFAPTTSYRLRGQDFSLYCVVSNDIRGMASLSVNIPAKNLVGYEIFDISDFLQGRVWRPMDLERHLEMFPGQVRLVLVAPPETCLRWRDELAARLIEIDRRQLGIHLGLARRHDLDLRTIDDLLSCVGSGSLLDDLIALDRARDMLVNLLYGCPTVSRTRSRIAEASSMACACDGALCRLLNRGKTDLAREWGLKVLPLAREFTMLRMELRRGADESLFEHADDLVGRARRLLTDIRSIK